MEEMMQAEVMQKIKVFERRNYLDDIAKAVAEAANKVLLAEAHKWLVKQRDKNKRVRIVTAKDRNGVIRTIKIFYVIR